MENLGIPELMIFALLSSRDEFLSRVVTTVIFRVHEITKNITEIQALSTM